MSETVTAAPATGCTSIQRDMLVVLDGAEGLSGQELASELTPHYELGNSRLYNNLSELTEEGLVTKQSRDGRTNEYSLTDQGRRTVRADATWRSGEMA